MKRWGIGLLNAAISGLTSGGLATGVGVNWKQTLVIGGGAALMSISKWLAQHPIPGADAQ